MLSLWNGHWFREMAHKVHPWLTELKHLQTSWVNWSWQPSSVGGVHALCEREDLSLIPSTHKKARCSMKHMFSQHLGQSQVDS